MSKCTKKTISWLLTLVMMFTIVMPMGAAPAWADEIQTVAEAEALPLDDEPAADEGDGADEGDDEGTTLIAAPVWPEDLNLNTTYYSISFNQPAACADTSYELVYRMAKSAEELEADDSWLSYEQSGFGDTFADYNKRSCQDLLDANTTYYVQAAYRTGTWGAYVFSDYSEVKQMTTKAAPEKATINFSIVAATKPSETPVISDESADYKGASYFTWYNNAAMEITPGTTLQSIAQTGFDALGFEDFSMPTAGTRMSVTMPEMLGDYTLARRSYGNYSQWYVTVKHNGELQKENNSFTVIKPHDGDEVILHYTFNYMEELLSAGNEGVSGNFVNAPALDTDSYEAANAVSAKIKAIGALADVNADSKTVVEAARTAYNALSEKAQALVSNYADLTAAEARIKAIEDGEITAITAPVATVGTSTAKSITINVPASTVDAAATVQTRYSTDGTTWSDWASAAAGDITIDKLLANTSYQIQARYVASDSTKYANSAAATVTASTTAFEAVTVEVASRTEFDNAVKGADTDKLTTIKLTADIELPNDGSPYSNAVAPEGANIIIDGDGHYMGLYTGNQNSWIVALGADSTVTLRNITMALRRVEGDWLIPSNSWSALVRFMGDNGVLNIEKGTVMFSNDTGLGMILNKGTGWPGNPYKNVVVNVYEGVLHNTGSWNNYAATKIMNLNGGTLNIIPTGNVMLEGKIDNAKAVNVKTTDAVKSGVTLSSDFATYTELTADELAAYQDGTAITYAAGLRLFTDDSKLAAIKAPVVLAADDANAATADITYVIADDKITFTVAKRDQLGTLMFQQNNAYWRESADAATKVFDRTGNTFTFSSLTKDTEYTYNIQTASLNPAYTDGVTTLKLTTTYTPQQLNTVTKVILEDKTSTSFKFSADACTQDATATTQYRLSTDGENWGEWQDSGEFTGLQPYTQYCLQVRYKAVSKYWLDSEPSETTYNKTKAADLTAPVLGAAADVKATSVTLAAPAACTQDTTATVWYSSSADGETWGDWQQSATFTGLKAHTKYYFRAMYKAGAAAWVDSSASNTITAKTLVDENAAMFMVGQVTGRVGDEVKVTVDMKNNPGVQSVMLDIGYDATKLELTKVEDHKLMGSFIGSETMAANPYVLYWDDTTASANITTSGTMATLTFKILDAGAVGDELAITVDYDPDNVFDKDLVSVSFDKVDGTITVVDHKWNAPTYKWSADYTTCTATRTCGDEGCENLIETETVTATEQRTEATDTENGEAVYTATFTNKAFTTQIHKETLYAIRAQFAAAKVSACPGSTVDVDITISNNPGIIDAMLYVAYNADKLELVGVKEAGLLNGYVSSDVLTANPYRLSWEDAMATENNTANGTLATLTFKLKDSCAVGDTVQLDLTYDQVYDTNLQPVQFRAANGVITVADHSWGTPTYTWSKDYSSCTAEAKCACGETLKEKATADVVTVDSTCSEAGSKTYTATFANAAFTKQTHVEDLALAAHDYVISGSNDAAALIYTCTKCNGTTTKTVSEETPVFVVSDARGSVGEDLQLTVSALNNPGIIAATLQLGYNAEELQLVKAENLSDLKSFSLSGNTIKLGGTNETANEAADGALIRLTFKALKDCDASAVSLSYKPADVYNYAMQNVEFAINNGAISAGSYILGDVNNDGKVDLLDVTVLRRHLADWEGYADIVKLAADVNEDGNIDLLDATILRRYLAGWEGVQLGKAS